MEYIEKDNVLVQQPVDSNTESAFGELSELQLALVGGGSGDVVFC